MHPVADKASVAPRAAGCCLATKLAPLGLPQAVCDGLTAQLDALLQLDTADDPRAHVPCREHARCGQADWPRLAENKPNSASQRAAREADLATAGRTLRAAAGALWR